MSSAEFSSDTNVNSSEESQNQLYEDAIKAEIQKLSKNQLVHLRESTAARARRLARNAERMREKRLNENEEDRKKRLERNALNNRLKRHNESTDEKKLRRMRDAARQRVRRALESDEQKKERLVKLAERMRSMRSKETQEQRAERLKKAAERARIRYLSETNEARKARLQKICDRAKKAREKVQDIKEEDTQSSIQDFSDMVESEVTISSEVESQEFTQLIQITGNQIVSPQPFCQNIISIPEASEVNKEAQNYINNFSFAIPVTYSYGSSFTNLSTINLTATDSIQVNPVEHQNIFITSNDNLLNAPQYQILTAIPAKSEITINSSNSSSSSIVSSPPTISSFQEITSSSLQDFDVAPPTPIIEKKSRGRPRKVYHDPQNWNELPKETKIEYARQQHMEIMVKQEMTDMMKNPPRGRGRPSKGNSNDGERMERLKKMAAMGRIRRANETAEQREARLKNLRERAQQRRDMVYATETEEQRHTRLIRQSEYARNRRLRMNTKEGKALMEKRARELYIKIHNNPESSSTDTVTLVKNDPDNDEAKTDKFSKILEPIIHMN